MIVIIILILFVVLMVLLFLTESDKQCPICGDKMDRAGNDWYCRECRKLWHMNSFGVLKERKR